MLGFLRTWIGQHFRLDLAPLSDCAVVGSRRGNEHAFKDIRRKVSVHGGTQDREIVKSKSDMDKMMRCITELTARQAEFENALKKKEAEKMLIYQVVPKPGSHLLLAASAAVRRA